MSLFSPYPKSHKIGTYHPLIIKSKHEERNPRDWVSECVDVLEYDETLLEMTVHFVMRGSYIYKGVEPQIYAEFNNAGSRGVYFNLYIRGNYESQRVG